MTDILFQELTRQIIGVYFDVYNGLSRTYPEFVYEKAMGAICNNRKNTKFSIRGNLLG